LEFGKFNGETPSFMRFIGQFLCPIAGLVCFLCPIETISQEHDYRYWGIQVDNDYFFNRDHYYSSGVFLYFGNGAKSSNDSGSYEIVNWTIGQEISTPYWPRYKSAKGDYPYNGVLFLERSELYFKNDQSGTSWTVLLGITGADYSLARPLHNFYHQQIKGIDKHVWFNPIPEALHINLSKSWYKAFELRGKWSVQGNSTINLGTYRIGIENQIGFQYGTLRKFAHHIFQPVENRSGFAFFTIGKLDFRIHEYGITGKLMPSSDNDYWELVPGYFTFEYGFVLKHKLWKFFINSIITSKQVINQFHSRHHYLSLGLTKYFR